MPGDFSIKGFVQADGGAYSYKNPFLDKSSIRGEYGITAGLDARKGNVFAQAQATFGNTLKASVSAGYEFKLGSNTGLEVSANAQYRNINHSDHPEIEISEYNFKTSSNPVTLIPNVIDRTEASVVTKDRTDTDSDYKTKSDTRASLGVAFTARAEDIKVKAGVRGGIRTTTGELTTTRTQFKDNYEVKTEYGHIEIPPCDQYPEGFTSPEIKNTSVGLLSQTQVGVEQDTAKEKSSNFFVTPTLGIEGQVSKNVSLQLDADLTQVNLGVRYTF